MAWGSPGSFLSGSALVAVISKWAMAIGQDLSLACRMGPQSHSQAGLCCSPTRFLWSWIFSVGNIPSISLSFYSWIVGSSWSSKQAVP